MRLPVTARIALLSIALALISNLVVLAFVRHQTREDAIAGVRRDTVEEVDALATAYRGGGEEALRSAIEDAADPGDPNSATALLDARGIRIAGTGPDRIAVPLIPNRFGIARLSLSDDWAFSDAGYTLRPVGRNWLIAAQMLTGVEDRQRSLERALAIGVLVAVALGILGGLIVSRYVARRLALISGVIAAVGEGDLTRRVAHNARGRDAFDDLAARLNVTLDKLEGLMAELRVVTDGLAHDLRSPLARLRTKTEQAVLLSEGTARDAALGGLLAETDLIMRMLTMLIEISRAEQVSRDRFVLVDPADLIGEIADLYQPVAEDAGFAFSIAVEGRPAPLRLHRELMSQAIANLVDNALRHGASGRAVTLRLRADAAEIAFEVADRGPGIAEADRSTALRRFGRLDSARSTPGAGLGMALVEAVARLHDGRVELADAQPGLAVTIILPCGSG